MKKRIKQEISCFLAAAMVLSGTPITALAAEDYVTAQEWYATEIGDIDQNNAVNTYASAYYGLWNKPYNQGEVVDRATKEVLVEGIPKQYTFYTPESWISAGSCVYVLVPDGYTGEEFANESSWMQVADDYGITVAFLSDENGTWDSSKLEEYLDYVIGVSTDLSARSIVNYNESSLYLVGYGAGSTVANYVGMNLVNLFAGVVLMGTPELSAEEVEAVGNMEKMACPLYGDYTRKEGTQLKDVNMPIWIVNDGEANEAVENYWKAANDVTDDAISNEYAVVYNQDPLFTDQVEDYEAASYVWVSSMEDASEKYDYDFTAYMWESFLSKMLRLRAEEDGTLYFNSVEQIKKLEYYQTEINGVKRYWAVYSPASYDGETKMPMVLFIHGHAHGIAGFFVNSGMWRAAEKYGFVLVYALGDPCTGHKNVACYTWVSSTSSESYPDEVEYFNTLLDNVTSDYSIDASRIYVTSHSAGSGMANQLAEEMPERFAALAPVGAPGATFRTLDALAEAAANTKGVAYGDVVQYSADEPEYSAEKVHLQVGRAMQNNGMSSFNTLRYQFSTGEYTETDYIDATSSLPLVKSVIWNGRTHTYLPEYFEKAWEQLSAYSRGENGALYYNGELVK